MTKKEANDTIDMIFNYIENSTDENNLKGHPGIFFFHSREDYNKLKESLLDKNEYDKYDIYYIGNKLIKYLVGRYDSHTKINIIDYKTVPLIFTKINDDVIVADTPNSYKDLIGKKVDSINGVPINTIVDELEQIICSGTKEYLDDRTCDLLRDTEVLKSLPSLKGASFIKYEIDGEEVLLNDEELSNNEKSTNYKVQDNICIIRYPECKDKERVREVLDEISKLDINDFIVDIRGNTGGNSNIIKPLIEYLKDKNVVGLIDRYIFSSGIFAALDLQNIGAYTVGSSISSPINHFGNSSGGLELEDLGLFVKTSRKYFLYDNGTYVSYTKDNFEDYFKDKKELLEPVIFTVDKEIIPTKEDYINENDVVMDYAINYIKGMHKNK